MAAWYGLALQIVQIAWLLTTSLPSFLVEEHLIHLLLRKDNSVCLAFLVSLDLCSLIEHAITRYIEDAEAGGSLEQYECKGPISYS